MNHAERVKEAVAKHFYVQLSTEKLHDAIDAMQAEIDRLTACLKKANESTEHFEREWYGRDKLHQYAEAYAKAKVAAERERLCAGLKIAMQHSAWDDVLQLDDALRNIDDMKGTV